MTIKITIEGGPMTGKTLAIEVLKVAGFYVREHDHHTNGIETCFAEIPMKAQFPRILSEPQRLAALPDSITIFKDGNAWFAVGRDFTNLQESDAGSGDSPLDALISLFTKDDPEVAEVFDILDAIVDERRRQDDKWGGPDHDDTHTTGDWRSIISRLSGELVGSSSDEKEASFVQIAATAMAAIQSIRRKCRG